MKRRHEMCGSFSSSSSSLLFRRSHQEIFSFFHRMCVSHQMGRVMPTNEKEILLFFASTKILCAQKSGRKLGPKNITRIFFSSCVSGRKRGRPPQTPFAFRKLTPPHLSNCRIWSASSKKPDKKEEKMWQKLGRGDPVRFSPDCFFCPSPHASGKSLKAKRMGTPLYQLRKTYFSKVINSNLSYLFREAVAPAVLVNFSNQSLRKLSSFFFFF